MGITTSPINPQHWRQPDVLWLTAFGLGFLRPAPGTWGSIGGLLVWWFGLAWLPWFVQLSICLIYALISWWLCHRVIARLGVDDAPQIVADEVVGMWLALCALPQAWWLAVLAFVLFRLLDVAKPGPVGWLDRRLTGGLGVMADDILAGALVGFVLHLSLFALN